MLVGSSGEDGEGSRVESNHGLVGAFLEPRFGARRVDAPVEMRNFIYSEAGAPSPRRLPSCGLARLACEG